MRICKSYTLSTFYHYYVLLQIGTALIAMENNIIDIQNQSHNR